MRTAGDGKTALKLACDYQPNVAILDIGLPGLDGFEVAAQLQAMDWAADLKLIAATGFDNMPIRRIAEQSGFHHFMTKPIDLTQLEAIFKG